MIVCRAVERRQTRLHSSMRLKFYSCERRAHFRLPKFVGFKKGINEHFVRRLVFGFAKKFSERSTLILINRPFKCQARRQTKVFAIIAALARNCFERKFLCLLAENSNKYFKLKISIFKAACR